METIALVGQQRLLLDGMSCLLLHQEKYQLSFSSPSGKDLLKFLASGNTVNVVIMHTSVSEWKFDKVLHEINVRYPDLKVLLISDSCDRTTIMEALTKKIAGFVLSEITSKELFTAIANVLKGEYYFSKSVLDEIIGNPMSQVETLPADLPELTRREAEIVKHIADGETTVEIAKKLYISPTTVETHRRNIFQKLQLKNSIELVKFAIKNGICEN